MCKGWCHCWHFSVVPQGNECNLYGRRATCADPDTIPDNEAANVSAYASVSIPKTVQILGLISIMSNLKQRFMEFQVG